MSAPPPLPDGFAVGHWTGPEGRTGCTVVIAPAGATGAVDVRGGGTSTRDLEALNMLANAEGPTAVLLTGGSAFGLVAADGVVRWLKERELGRATPFGPVPLVPAAVIFDLVGHDSPPGPEQGYAACEVAASGVPQRGAIGAGAHAAVGKALGRERATPGGVGYAASQVASGATIAVLAVVNAVGDVIGSDGEVIAGPTDGQGRPLRSAALIPTIDAPPVAARPGENTTLVCVCTDASLDKRGCGIIARMASAGVARAVDPVFSPLDGDVVFCVSSRPDPTPAPGVALSWRLTVLGTLAATVTAEAIRDGVTSARGPRQRPAGRRD